ncbi:MAG: CRTAC1 family protein [Thermogemmata sp.]|nr:CRTAC1 family protein [Gemmataceae bacterium]
MRMPLTFVVWLLLLVLALPLLALTGESSAGIEEKAPFPFEEVAEKTGLWPALQGIRGHGAAWGDVNGDGWLDLIVGTFGGQPGDKPNLLFLNHKGRFHLDEQPILRIANRATGMVFADLDNDGDLDLYIGSMPQPKNKLRGCSLFRNDGGGKFTDISAGNGACPLAFGGRSVAVLDYDGDGLLDLLVGEDPIRGYNGSTTRSSRLFRNRGRLQFEDATQAAGIPADIPGYGVVAADFNNDTWPDIFMAANSGGNRLFLNDGRGKFRAADSQVFQAGWPDAGGAGGDNMICGVCAGDVNRDGLLDLYLGQHYAHPWVEPVANRLYLHRGIRNGLPLFEDVTTKAGLVPLPLKAPHVEIQDFDNDGWPDLYASLVTFANQRSHPLIYKGLGVRPGGDVRGDEVPTFRQYALGVNDFPTPQDRQVRSSAAFFARILREKKIIYMPAGPAADFDNDGRLDLFLPNWWAEAPSLLLRNATPGGHWLQVQCDFPKGPINRQGIGCRIYVYPTGKLGQPGAMLGCREIAVGYGYASGQPAIAHFGLGSQEKVDLEIVLPHGQGTLTRRSVSANQRLVVRLE